MTEFRRVPTASGVSGAVPGEYEFYGKSNQISVQNNFAFTVDLFKGETVFQPVDWAIVLEPVFNVNYLQTQETGVVSPDPRGRSAAATTRRRPTTVAWKSRRHRRLLNGQVSTPNSYRNTRARIAPGIFRAAAGVHRSSSRDLSENYDFVSVRAGNQPFNSDFRGFIFNDVNLAARLFGNYDNNRWQYNVVVFDMNEKDTNSELNKFDGAASRFSSRTCIGRISSGTATRRN